MDEATMKGARVWPGLAVLLRKSNFEKQLVSSTGSRQMFKLVVRI